MSEIYQNLDLLPEDLSGWNGNSTVFEKLINDVKPSTIIEVGSWKGQSAINMGKIIKKNNLPCRIYCVDTWLGSIEFLTTLKNTPERNLLLKNGYPQIYYQFLSNVVHNNLQDIIIPIPNTSVNGFKYLEYNNIKSQLIYIDASHEEDEVYNDIKNYYNLLTSDGVIFGDDYNSYWYGVINAVNRFSI